MAYNPTTGPRRLFVLAGMPRAGTTYVYHAFAAHPEAFVPYRKELRFFSLNYDRGRNWYARFFSQAAPGLVCIDTSPDYFMDVAALTRLLDFSPEIKVALAVRDPAAWAVSLHRQFGTLESDVPKFREFLMAAKYPDFDFSWWRRKPELRFSLRNGFVQSQLTAFREAFGERLLLYDFALFERDPPTVLRALESFLGMSPFFSTGNLPGGRINARGRGSRRWISYLSSRDILINIAGLLLPRQWLIGWRMKMDQAAPESRGKLTAGDTEDLTLAHSVLASDIAFVKSLFSESPLVLGNGCPYRAGDQSP